MHTDNLQSLSTADNLLGKFELSGSSNSRAFPLLLVAFLLETPLFLVATLAHSLIEDDDSDNKGGLRMYLEDPDEVMMDAGKFRHLDWVMNIRF
jgi:hypothetical protein